jgi:hypothetical protein
VPVLSLVRQLLQQHPKPLFKSPWTILGASSMPGTLFLPPPGYNGSSGKILPGGLPSGQRSIH